MKIDGPKQEKIISSGVKRRDNVFWFSVLKKQNMWILWIDIAIIKMIQGNGNRSYIPVS